VHPGGPYWARKDEGAWTIPKGEPSSGEELLEAAKREFREETGFSPAGKYVPLEPIKQAGGKVIHAWAVRGDLDPLDLESNTFSMEWPPRSGKLQSFPEVDRAGWFPIDLARGKILKGQVALLDQLQNIVAEEAEHGRE